LDNHHTSDDIIKSLLFINCCTNWIAGDAIGIVFHEASGCVSLLGW